MWYFYVLESEKNKTFYKGFTDNVKRRLLEHNSKKGGQYTSKNGPFRLIFYEAYLDKRDAADAERYFKTGHGREVLKNKISNYLRDK